LPGDANTVTVSTGSTATSFSAGGLSNGEYLVRVRASNANGTSPPSFDTVFLIGPFCPSTGPPANLSAAVSGSSVTLTWTAGARAFSYQLQAGSTAGASDAFSGDLRSSVTSLFATNVAAGTYFVRVLSLNACGQPNGASNEAVVVVP
jgi:predicted phage tail protein